MRDWWKGLAVALCGGWAVLLAAAISVEEGESSAAQEPLYASSYVTQSPTSPPPSTKKRRRVGTENRPSLDSVRTPEFIANLAEAERLSTAMCGYLVEVDRVHPNQCERRDLSGLASILVDVVDELHREGQWVPLGRHKAPAFLAAISRGEISWWWKRDEKGAVGERCAFQLAQAARAASGFSTRELTTNAYACTRGAISWMKTGMEYCGGERVPAEAWFSWFATKGYCGVVQDVVEKRFETARWLLQRIGSPDGTG